MALRSASGSVARGCGGCDLVAGGLATGEGLAGPAVLGGAAGRGFSPCVRRVGSKAEGLSQLSPVLKAVVKGDRGQLVERWGSRAREHGPAVVRRQRSGTSAQTANVVSATVCPFLP